MPQNTEPTLTHNQRQSNFFEIPSNKIAYSGILERIDFAQWHIFGELNKITRNLNLINFASLLAVFPRMGIYAYRISQAELAEKMASLFDMAPPSRKTISSWELQLRDIGFLDIPEHVDWRRSKTKIRVITEKFWNVSRKGLEFLSYTCPRATEIAGKVERVVQGDPKVPNNNILVSEIRAREADGCQPGQSRAVSFQKNEKGQEKAKTTGQGTDPKFSRPPRHGGKGPRGLEKFQNSICHWLFQNNNLESYREAVILFARFLELPQNDDYVAQLRRAWKDCRDAERPGHVTGLIKFLRALGPGVTVGESAPPPLRVVVNNDFPHVRMSDPEKAALLRALRDGGEYTGKYRGIHQYFNSVSERDQVWIVRNLDKLIQQSAGSSPSPDFQQFHISTTLTEFD